MAHAEAETADHLKKRKQQRRNRSAIAREQHLKDWNLTTARKFGADSDGHGRHPILTDARGVTDHQDGWRSSWESLVNLNLETCISSLAGPGGVRYHAGASHVARHAGTEGFKMALEAARNRPTVRGREPSAKTSTSESPSHRGDQREETPRRRLWRLDGDSQACDWKSAAAH